MSRTSSVLVLMVLACCDRGQVETRDHASRDSGAVRPDARVVIDATETIDAAPRIEWESQYDFDGDHQPDLVDVAFSGGAHCCYTLAVHLTRTKRVVPIPFELDGGYVGGLSLKRPENFTIEVGPDGIATMVMQIAMYGGRPDDIPVTWKRVYGIKTHSIRVDLRNGAMRARDR